MNLRNVILDTEHGLVKKKGKVCVSWFRGFLGDCTSVFPTIQSIVSEITKINMAVNKTHMVIATTFELLNVG